MSSGFSISRVLPLTTLAKGYGVEIVFSNETQNVIWIDQVEFSGRADQHIQFCIDKPFHHAITYRIQLQCGLTVSKTGRAKTRIIGKVSQAKEPLWAYIADGEFNHEFPGGKGKSWNYRIGLPVLISVAPNGKSAVRLVFALPSKVVLKDDHVGTGPDGMYISRTTTDCWLRATTDRSETIESKMDDSFFAFLANKGKVVKSIKGPLNRVSQTTKRKQTKPLSLLFLTADPTDELRLRIGEELREIQEKLKLARLRERFIIHSRTSVRPADLSQALLDTKPQIVHFSGHGNEEGSLCLESPSGAAHLVSVDALASLFKEFKSHVNCVVLNACYSEEQARAIVHHIDYVIGMNRAIGDKAAIAFSIGFYQGLGDGRNIEESFQLGCVQIRLQGIPEHLTPVLLKQ